MDSTDFLRLMIDLLEQLNFRYMLVGSIASIRYGEPRYTHDIDIVIDLPIADVSRFCEKFPPPDFYLSEQAVRDGIRTRVPFNILHTTSGNKIDVILPRDDEWGRLQLSRRRKVLLLPDREGYTASPEDVILGKLWYYSLGESDKHLRDIAGILRISGEQVDRVYVTEWATKLGYEETWSRIQASVDTV
jgi:hypothetical protein